MVLCQTAAHTQDSVPRVGVSEKDAFSQKFSRKKIALEQKIFPEKRSEGKEKLIKGNLRLASAPHAAPL